MANTVTLSDRISFAAESDQSILEAARSQDVALEHSCCSGRCGVCKAKVARGLTKAIKPEASLSEDEMLNGFILTCCRSATTDVQLDIESLESLGGLKAKILPCRINQIHLLADDVIAVTLRTPPSSFLEYLPGQYVNVIGEDGIRRSYSIANAPRDDGTVTLQIRKVEAGQMSDYWFNRARANDLLRIEGPLGTFCLRKTKASTLILLATGTGIAPLKAILEQLSASPRLNTYNSIHLYWGGRTEQDLYWRPEFSDLQVHYIPVLSRSPEWKGLTGYVQQAALSNDLDLGDAVVYACGSEAMIHDARTQFISAGLAANQFYYESFVSSD